MLNIIYFLDEWNSYIELAKDDAKNWDALESHVKAGN